MRLDTGTGWTDILRVLLVVLEGVYKSCALPNRQAPTGEKTAALYRFVSSCYGVCNRDDVGQFGDPTSVNK